MNNESFPDCRLACVADDVLIDCISYPCIVLILMDDDTYYNMKLVTEIFRSIDSSTARAMAGCRVRSPTKLINFTFPFGGYGFIVSKGWLKKVTKPILCPRDADYCRFIRRTNHLGEKEVFQNGMTLADLAYAYATHQPYEHYRNWTNGFCLHSDWYVCSCGKPSRRC